MGKLSLKHFVLVFSIYQLGSQVSAQDLEPRALSTVPVKSNFLFVACGYSEGYILLDNSLPIEDLNARLGIFVAGYARSFKLFSKLTKVDVVIPYAFANFSALVDNKAASTSRMGFGDPTLRVSMVLYGVKPVGLKSFSSTEQKKFKLGINSRLKMPLGQYNPSKLLNLGTNRWTTNLGVLATYTFIKKLILEAQVGVWMFTKNTSFFNGNTIEQKPLTMSQLHVTYIFNPKIWLAVSYGRSGFGETIVNGVEKNNSLDNSRFGAAFAYRVSKKHALKMSYTNGITTRYGSNFSSFIIGYQFLWFDKNGR